MIFGIYLAKQFQNLAKYCQNLFKHSTKSSVLLPYKNQISNINSVYEFILEEKNEDSSYIRKIFKW